MNGYKEVIRFPWNCPRILPEFPILPPSEYLPLNPRNKKKKKEWLRSGIMQASESTKRYRQVPGIIQGQYINAICQKCLLISIEEIMLVYTHVYIFCSFQTIFKCSFPGKPSSHPHTTHHPSFNILF